MLARELNTPDLIRTWEDLADTYGMRVFDALTVAVPYCDVVGTYNAQAHALTITRLADRMGTVIMRPVTELTDYL